MEWFSFRKFITPIVLQVIFWLGVLACIGIGLWMIIEGGNSGIDTGIGWMSVETLGVFVLLLGPFVWRIYIEMYIVVFQIYDQLRSSE